MLLLQLRHNRLCAEQLTIGIQNLKLDRTFATWLLAFLLSVTCSVALSDQSRALRNGRPHNFPTELDPLRKGWYASMMQALHENYLWKEDNKQEVYRFIWLRTFHHPVAVRVEHTNGSTIAVQKESSGAGGYEPGRLIVDRQTAVTNAEFSTLKTKFDTALFWREPFDKTSEYGCDGAVWIFEARNAKGYHVIERWAPKQGRPYHELGLLMLKQSGFEFAENEAVY